MNRSFFALVLLLLITCTLPAAPAPRTIWDRPIDPDRDCKFDIDKGGRSATIELPGTDHDLAPERGRCNAPRLLRDVAGDFVMQVRVSSFFRPSAKSPIDKMDPLVAAGLLLIPADENCIRLDYGAYRRNGELRTCPAFRIRGKRIWNMEMDWNLPWKEERSTEKEAHMYLRLERRGDLICEAISPDGEKWHYSFKVRLKNLPEKLVVGLAAYSTSTEPFKVRFDKFRFARGERKGPEPRGSVFTGKFER